MHLSIKKQTLKVIHSFSQKAIPILVYHRVEELHKAKYRWTVSPKMFESHMQYLEHNDITPVSLDQMIEIETSGKQNKKKYVAITFDDGYLDNYQIAFPILQKYRFTATIFLITSLVGMNKPAISGNVNEYASWSNIKEMQKYGISFQSHTCTHRNLKLLDSTEARLELSDSRKIIEDTLRKPVLHLAYPYGKYTINVMKIAEETGYQLAYAAGYSYLNDQFSRARFDTLNLTIKFPYLFPIVTNGWGDVAREFWGLLRLWTKTTSKKQYLL